MSWPEEVKRADRESSVMLIAGAIGLLATAAIGYSYFSEPSALKLGGGILLGGLSLLSLAAANGNHRHARYIERNM